MPQDKEARQETGVSVPFAEVQHTEGRSCYIKVLKTGWSIFTTLLLIAAAVLVALFALPRLSDRQ